MAVIPEPKVNPEALPWARKITTAIQSFALDLDRLRLDSSNTNKQLNATTRLLANGTWAKGVDTDQPIETTGVGTFTGGLKSKDVHTRSVTYGGAYTATYTHLDGTMGTAPSSERFKENINPADIDLEALDRAEVVTFQYKDAVSNMGEDAPRHIGGIAEQFAAVGLGHAVSLDEDGLPFSIEDRPLIYTLLLGYQQLQARVTELEAALASTA